MDPANTNEKGHAAERQPAPGRTSAAPRKNDAGKTKLNKVEAPSITLPKGGGAVKSIDEKFSVNAANGTSSFGIPLPFTEGRSGHTPALSLHYNSGTGNSPFGIGWELQLPAIQRKTDKHLPEYNDADETDIFLMAGAEDLVPELAFDAGTSTWKRRTKTEGNYLITQYRPRVEGGFARIEKIQRRNESFFYWKVTTRENVVTFFGKSPTHRIAHPQNEWLIFKWLPEISFDDKGNLTYYEYKKEDTQQIIRGTHERNRSDTTISNKHLKKVHYANKTAFYPGYILNKANLQEIYDTALPAGTVFLMMMVFDYGEHTTNQVAEAAAWNTRPDPFSNYTPGFDMRTYRRCSRVLMFHNFIELRPLPVLVKSLNLAFMPSSVNADQYTQVSYLIGVQQTGYADKAGTLTPASFPPINLSYEPLKWNKTIHDVPKEDLVNAPIGLAGGYRWMDLWSEGISGILTEQGDGLYFKRNLGPKAPSGTPEFAPAARITPKPSFNGLANGTLQITDLEGNGKKQVVIASNGTKGFFEIDEENEWAPFQAFLHTHNLDMADSNIKMLDLNGDGRPDLLISEENIFTWHLSAGKKGYDAGRTVHKPYNEENGPAILFADAQQSIYTADMNGDGLTDIVRIRNNDICYWPNMGYGKFGAKVTMENAPCFDKPDQFNPGYIQLADISGTGATDIIYLGKNLFRAWLNLSGNSWSEAEDIYPFPSSEQPNSISVVDLLGNGTSCIVWSSPMLRYREAPMRYIDLMGGKKPHLLKFYTNGMGKETSIQYRSSTSYYLADKKAGYHWITRLPFPVHCVNRVEVEEKISHTKFINEYAYHDGYYDHEEREFRGFGMVEQTDTEDYEHWKRQDASNVTDERLHQDPVKVKSWFHTGCFFQRAEILQHFKQQYYKNISFTEYVLPDAFLETTLIGRALSAREWREAIRCCKGMMLRKETYALDHSGKDHLPYTVEEQNCHIKILQPVAGTQYGVLLVQPRESVTYRYERNDKDPRISHNISTEIDEYGQVLKQASVVYRRQIKDIALPQAVQDEQDRSWITYIENHYTTPVINDANRPEAYRLGQLAESITWELTGMNKPVGQFFSVDGIQIFFTACGEIPYEQKPGGGLQKRKIEQLRHLFLKNDLRGPLPLLQQESLGIEYESYKLSFTNGLVQQCFKRDGVQLVTDTELTDGKYLKNLLYKPASPQPATAGLFPASDKDDDWWALSGIHGYPANAAAAFYIPDQYIDVFGNSTRVKFDANYHLHVIETEDASTSKTSVLLFNYRVMMPQQVRDINENLSEIRFDIMGMVVGAALMGKGAESDDFTGFDEDPTPAQVAAFLNDPAAHAANLLGRATSRFVYDHWQYVNSAGMNPVVVANISRETHFHMPGGAATNMQMSFEYADGIGDVILKKVQAEPGMAKELSMSGGLLTVVDVDTGAALRWAANARAVKNNKGAEIKKFEPYFSTTHHYEHESQLVEIGMSPLYFYDPIERLVRTELPNGTFTHAEFDAWSERKFDTNDNISGSGWYNDRIGGAMGLKEQEAAQKAIVHANTPAHIFLDTLGRSFYTVDSNRFRDRTIPLNIITEEYHSLVVMDVEGRHLRVIDPRNVAKMRNGDPFVPLMEYDYDLAGNKIRESSMDAGVRWVFNDCMGKAMYGWDSKEHQFTTNYDVMNRPIEHKVLLPAVPAEGLPAREIIFDRTIFGANTAPNRLANMNGKPVTKYDGAGKVDFEGYDFKGNALKTSRRFTVNYDVTPDWTIIGAIALQPGTPYSIETAFDALNRPTSVRSAEQSIYRPVYNEAGLMNQLFIKIRGGAETPFINNIDHDAKGQRSLIEYANNTRTDYTYDPKTLRLTGMTTTRTTDSKKLQDLRYTYDPTGNITSITDAAVKTVYFNDTIISPDTDFEYDAIYRLILSEGREHISSQQPPNESDIIRRNVPLPVDELAMQRYKEYYYYDEVGNMLHMVHQAGRGAWALRWTRDFGYGDASNQLQSMDVAGVHQTFTYDAHGLMETLPHLSGIRWDFEGNLEQIDKGGGGKVFYNYDAEGNRVRKVWEKPGNIVEERVYVGNAEVFTQTQGGTVTLRRETLHVLDDKKRIALVETRTDTNPAEQLIRYQYNNFLGTSALELDDAGDIISFEEYYAFGNTSFQSGRSLAEVSLKRYRYTGKERDEESGLYYHGSRYYAPWLARWTAPDPAGVEDGPNVYVYVRNNPINSHDPTGLISWRTVAIIAAVVVVGVVVTVATAGAAGPIIAGAVASAGLTGTAATVTTAVVVGAAAGAAGGAASELTRQVASGEQISGRAIGRAALEGAAFGAVTGGLGAGATAFSASARGAATIARVTQTAGRASQAVARATPAAVRTVAAATARGVATAGRGLAAGARAVGIPQAGRALGRGLQAIETASGRVGLAAARSTFSSGSSGARMVARYAATGGDVAEAFGVTTRTSAGAAEREISRATIGPNPAINVRFGDLSSGAKRLVRAFERGNSSGIGSGVLATDLANASQYLGLEVGVLQSEANGAMRAVLGGPQGIPRGIRRPDEFHVAHTHPVYSSEADHFKLDISTATSRVEAVIDWGHNITFFNNTGVLASPATRPINELGYIIGSL